MDSPRFRVVLATLVVCAVAAGARFVKLGAWSFAADEVASLQEADALFGNHPVTDDPITRLPRMTPLGPVLHGLAFRELGRTEFAARVPAAIAGVLLCGLAVVGLWTALGGWGATATGLLIALNPEFVFYSQYNRYYSIGTFLAGGCVFAGLAAVRQRSARWMLLAAVLATAGVADHLILVGLFPGLIAGALLAPALAWQDRSRLAAVVVIVGSVVAAVGMLYLVPLAGGWNSGVGWGYSIPRALAGGLNQLGVPTALLAGLGTVLMVTDRYPLRWFWAVWAAGWLASLVVLPQVLAFHPGYSFLYLLGPIVLAGYAVGQVAEKLAGHGPGLWRRALPGAAWLGVAVMFNALPLASHYQDGSRYDFRAGARFVAAERQPGETVAAVSPGNFAFYEPGLADALPLSPERLNEGLQKVRAANRPCWIVLLGGRGPRDGGQSWLNQHCRLKVVIRKTRFDYYDFAVEVYLFEPGKG